MDTAMREKSPCCKQIVGDGMLASYKFSKKEEQEIMDFMFENKDKMREVSLRMVTKIADPESPRVDVGKQWLRLHVCEELNCCLHKSFT